MADSRVLVAALAVLVYALVSRRLDRWYVSMPAALVVLGYLAGPDVLGLVDTSVGSEVVKETAELALSLMLFHDAVRIDLRALRRGYAVPLRLLAVGLPLMIVLGTLVGRMLLPGLGLVGAALVATMLAPTDAALGEAVVSDERLPVRIRQGLNVESGLNDGLSVPVFLVLLAIAADPGAVGTNSLAEELARQLGLGVLCGVAVGAGGGLLFRIAAAKGLMEDAWRRVAVLMVAVGCFVSAAVAGGSGFIGAFVGGIAFGLAAQARSPSDNAFTGYVGTVFNAFSFFLLGAVVLPFALNRVTGAIVLYAVLSLVVIRLVSVAVAMVGSRAQRPTVAFMGWFGPRGLATLVFAVLVVDEGIPDGGVIATAAAIGVTISVFAHGFTAPPLVAAYARWWHRAGRVEGKPMEAKPVFVHRVHLSRFPRQPH